MALAFALIDTDASQKYLELMGKLTISGNYVPGGDPLNLQTGDVPADLIPALPVLIVSQDSTPGTNLFVYIYVPGTNLSNGKVQVFTGAAAQTGLTELAAGAYPAGVLADQVYIRAKVLRFA